MTTRLDHCERSVCRAILAYDGRWCHTDTGLWYCRDCAAKINKACPERPGLVVLLVPGDGEVLRHHREAAKVRMARGQSVGPVMAYVLSSAWSTPTPSGCTNRTSAHPPCACRARRQAAGEFEAK